MGENINQKSIEDIKKLSVSERILIVEDIWDSITSSKESFPVSDEQKKELDLRLEAYYKNPDEGRSWKEVKDNIKSLNNRMLLLK